MDKSDILKGNYQIPGLKEKLAQPDTNQDKKSLEEQFEAAALKRLGGSITFVKKSGSFTWKGDDNKKGKGGEGK